MGFWDRVAKASTRVARNAVDTGVGIFQGTVTAAEGAAQATVGAGIDAAQGVGNIAQGSWRLGVGVLTDDYETSQRGLQDFYQAGGNFADAGTDIAAGGTRVGLGITETAFNTAALSATPVLFGAELAAAGLDPNYDGTQGYTPIGAVETVRGVMDDIDEALPEGDIISRNIGRASSWKKFILLNGVKIALDDAWMQHGPGGPVPYDKEPGMFENYLKQNFDVIDVEEQERRIAEAQKAEERRKIAEADAEKGDLRSELRVRGYDSMEAAREVLRSGETIKLNDGTELRPDGFRYRTSDGTPLSY